jgi:tRNA threonylcarbamoyl adenosine modification protein YeaZ
MQLAIDTSTTYAGIALVEGQDILAEYNWRCGLNHSIELTPTLEMVLARAHLNIDQIDCVFVARGPGSFNGLRVGVSAAKGLAFSLGIPIIGISTLEATAYQFAVSGLPVCSVQNAGREELAAGLFQLKPRKGWTRLVEEQITTPAALNDLIKIPTIICGELNPVSAALLKKLFRSKAIFTSPAGQIRRAAYLAELGQIRRLAGDFASLTALQPMYLRRPPISERKNPY